MNITSTQTCWKQLLPSPSPLQNTPPTENQKKKNTSYQTLLSLCLCWILPIASAWTSGKSQDHPWAFAVLCRPCHRFSRRRPFLIQLLGYRRREGEGWSREIMEPSEGRQSLKKRSVKVVTGDVYPSVIFCYTHQTYSNMSFLLHHREL